MKTKLVMTGLLAAVGLAAGDAMADDRLPLERIDQILTHGSAFGYQHYKELEAKSSDSVEIEGWMDDEWFAEARLSIESGDSLKENRERLITGAWGMSEEEVRQAFEVAAGEGMVSFEEIKIDEKGMIEIEGENDQGQELEVKVRQGDSAVASVERD
ncbi:MULTISPECIES: PepSY domain-containing protein [Halomonadaceae]|mgnify:CR=1 FL=1|uniref:PepSY domain-containing protein n=1 Tax=Vreelandella titanicae TaxID=664683 RepID=A0AAP9T2Q5_9GAMM|nr:MULTISPECIES: PepSY domain-containing protein [Halomonas]QKS27282.1 hypothetical protein FX987_05103 [Halomonas titanicae]CDG51114.1 conserved exported hypothetical protein [Halomonas sp. A3H3]SDJ02503.1 Peptidase propeptide and YPEB domain-containing protein [Halomonas titanicae]|tara:strand:- start:76 stop:546 length:471 start_codon:yes stop_codon:yes gene_type:complete